MLDVNIAPAAADVTNLLLHLRDKSRVIEHGAEQAALAVPVRAGRLAILFDSEARTEISMRSTASMTKRRSFRSKM